MISALLALQIVSLNPFQTPTAVYDFPVDSETKFNVKIAFDGYVPILGGHVGKVDVDMVVRAKSVLEKSPLLQAVESEIIELKATAFGSALPLNKNNIGQFFPKATATFEPGGKVKFNGADAVKMPVNLPGLDSQRLPEISYLPVVLDKDAMLSGKEYSFERTFNGVPMTYTVIPGDRKDSSQTVNILVSQNSVGFEDAYGNPAVEASAKSKTKTTLKGTGKGSFNFSERKFDKVVVVTEAETDVTNIKTGKTTKRNLKTTLTIVRDGAKVDE